MFKQPGQLIFALSMLILVGCGGGGSSDGGDPSGGGTPTYTAGVFADPDTFKNRCENPRNTTDIDGRPYPDMPGSILHENHWLRSWSNDTYLWYQELPDINPGNYSDPLEYFDLLVTPELTNSGTPKDRFHFTYDTDVYEQLSQAGISVSYGIEWELISRSPPRELYIRYVESGSPADAAPANLTRGVKIIEIDGEDVESGDPEILNPGLFPSEIGESHTFLVQDVGSTTTREVTLTAQELEFDPVPIVDTFSVGPNNVGYIFFNDHNIVSEDRLFDAITEVANNNISDLILDLRYNGGGYLYIASQLSYMIAGPVNTNSRTFETLRFNDKYPTINPVTGNVISPTPFYNATSQNSAKYGSGVSLPQLNLNRVFILTTDGTCSASEAIINGLRGIDIEVILIGSTTCGKPYGFYATDNCGTTYFTIQFDGINDKGEGGYSDGFTPMNEPNAVGILQNGCYVPEDLSSTLGAQSDPLIAAALEYRNTGTCPAITKTAKIPTVSKDGLGTEQLLLRQIKRYDNPFENQDKN